MTARLDSGLLLLVLEVERAFVMGAFRFRVLGMTGKMKKDKRPDRLLMRDCCC